MRTLGGLLSSFLLACVLSAANPTPLAPSEVAEPSPLLAQPTRAQRAGAQATFIAAFAASNAVAAALAYVPPRVQFDRAGRPDPLVTTGGLLLGALAQVALAPLLAEAYRIGDADLAQVRRTMWQWSRWPALGAAVAVLLFGAGALLERNDFGRGQGLMIGGAALLAVSWVTFDVTAIIGANRGYREQLP
jgi:hypothetical protein